NRKGCPGASGRRLPAPSSSDTARGDVRQRRRLIAGVVVNGLDVEIRARQPAAALNSRIDRNRTVRVDRAIGDDREINRAMGIGECDEVLYDDGARSAVLRPESR